MFGVDYLIMACTTAHCVSCFQISVEPISGKKVEHNGIKVELLGQIGIVPFLLDVIQILQVQFS